MASLTFPDKKGMLWQLVIDAGEFRLVYRKLAMCSISFEGMNPGLRALWSQIKADLNCPVPRRIQEINFQTELRLSPRNTLRVKVSTESLEMTFLESDFGFVADWSKLPKEKAPSLRVLAYRLAKFAGEEAKRGKERSEDLVEVA